MAAAKLKIKHEIIQKFQIEPSHLWRQNVTAEQPYIFHYTFGHEYSVDGVPMVGQVGEWSLDKRRWTAVYPPHHLTPPPACAGEATHVLTGAPVDACVSSSLRFVKRATLSLSCIVSMCACRFEGCWFYEDVEM